MSNFENNPFGPADGQAGAEAHYLGSQKVTGMPEPVRKNPYDSPRTADPNRVQAYATPKALKIPAGKAPAQSGLKTHAHPPQQRGRPVERRPSTNQDMRTIGRGADGRFDAGNIRTSDPRLGPSPFVGLSRQSSSNPRSSSTAASDRGRSPSATPRRRTSSIGEWIKEKIRRFSGSLKDKADILAMSEDERDDHIVRQKRNLEAEAAQRRARYDVYSHESTSRPKGPTSKPSTISLNSTYSASSSRKSHGPAVLYPNPNQADLGEYKSPDQQLVPEFSTGEKLAIKASKTLDPIKQQFRHRKGSSDSDLSFADFAPEDTDAMVKCARCGRVPRKFVRNAEGVCEDCVEEIQRQRLAEIKIARAGLRAAVEADSPFEPRFPLRRAQTDPDEPSPPYVKVGKNKLIRLRHTIYEDPGNPFASDEETADLPSFTLPFRIQSPLSEAVQSIREEHEHTITPGEGGWPLEEMVSRGHARLLSGQAFEDELSSPESSQKPSPTEALALANSLHGPSPEHQGTSALLPRDEHQSFQPRSDRRQIVQEYEGASGSPVSDLRRGGVLVYPNSRRGRPVGGRDTKFYAFYDGFLGDYDYGSDSG
ncbi:hypothetical protein EJ03DRAFT_350867 [Teratosphaeria nubilosa]|uniref:Uncharacterized protein n=1 Tax=Teratosphaeria nubilosa TaxID=161662 RepID=A0A6G1LAE5_9PEZI|nr:hypothetical protein EJ03DRAFT_350867 [Teratosphaeria nubilosa]